MRCAFYGLRSLSQSLRSRLALTLRAGTMPFFATARTHSINSFVAGLTMRCFTESGLAALAQ
jgi:hypothetical protein